MSDHRPHAHPRPARLHAVTPRERAAEVSALQKAVARELGPAQAFAGFHKLPGAHGQPLLAAALRDNMAAKAAEGLNSLGYRAHNIPKLARQARRADRLSRGVRAAVVSLGSTVPLGMCASAGGMAGAAIGTPLGPLGAVIGSLVGGIAGTLVALPVAAASSTALYQLEDAHRHANEGTARRPVGDRTKRARNGLAYGVGGLAGNAPIVAGSWLTAGLLTGGAAAAAATAWSVAGLALAPVTGAIGTLVRVAVLEGMDERTPARLFGIVKCDGGAGITFDESAMHKKLGQLQRGTSRYVWNDLRTFAKAIRAGYGREFKGAYTHNAKQCGLTGLTMLVSQALGLGVGAAAVAGGMPHGWMSPVSRATSSSVGNAVYGTSRPVRAGHGGKKHSHGAAVVAAAPLAGDAVAAPKRGPRRVRQHVMAMG